MFTRFMFAAAIAICVACVAPASSNAQVITHRDVGVRMEADRAEGTFATLVATQLSSRGLYLPPVFVTLNVSSTTPPQTIISFPVQTAS